MSHIRAKFAALIAEVKGIVPERDDIVEGIFACLLSKRHVLLLGPPGTAKSYLVTAVTDRIIGSKTFVRLLTKFSAPEELFGPYSIKGLENDRYERIVQGMLPASDVAFIDECFKANAAILNSLLTLMNERAFDNGVNRLKCPLVTLVGASNETPQDESLGALYDRFMLRYFTSYLSEDDNFAAVMLSGASALSTTITLAELESAQVEVSKVAIDRAFILSHIMPLKRACEAEGFRVSDRRWRESMDLLRAVAWLDDRTAVEGDDLMVYAHILWDKPEDRAKVASLIAKIVNPALQEVQEAYDLCRNHLRAMQVELGKPEANQGTILEYHQKAKAQIVRMKKFNAGTRGKELCVKAELAVKEAIAKGLDLLKE